MGALAQLEKYLGALLGRHSRVFLTIRQVGVFERFEHAHHGFHLLQCIEAG
jgi:hypothetical protein